MKRYMVAACGFLALGFGFVRPAAADIVNGVGTIDGFGDFSGFTISQTDAGPAPTTGSGAIHISTTSANESRTVTFNTPVDISQFTATWNFQATNILVPLGGSAGDKAEFSLTTAQGFIDVIFQAVGPESTWVAELQYAGPGVPLFQESFGLNSVPTGISTEGLFPHLLLSGASSTNVGENPGGPTGEIFTYNVSTPRALNVMNTPNLADILGALGAGPATLSFSATTDGLGADQSISDFEFSNVPEPCSAGLMLLGAGLGLRRSRRRR